MLDPLPDGMGEWVTLYAPKWDYLWVETYRKIDPPVDFKYWFRLHEYGNELQDLPFENGEHFKFCLHVQPTICLQAPTRADILEINVL